MDEYYILGQKEFQILAASRGIRHFFGAKTELVLDETTVLYEIHEMTRKGILEKKGDGFEMHETYRTLLDGMSKASKLMAVYDSREERGNLCLYRGERLICFETSPRDADAVRIGAFGEDKLFDFLEEKEFLPEATLDTDLVHLSNPEDYREEILAAPVLLRFEVSDNLPEAEKKNRLELVKVRGRYWVRKPEEDGTVVLLVYDKKQTYEAILAML